MRLTLAEVKFAFPELTDARAVDLLRVLARTYREGYDDAANGADGGGVGPRPAVVDSLEHLSGAKR